MSPRTKIPIGLLTQSAICPKTAEPVAARSERIQGATPSGPTSASGRPIPPTKARTIHVQATMKPIIGPTFGPKIRLVHT